MMYNYYLTFTNHITTTSGAPRVASKGTQYPAKQKLSELPLHGRRFLGLMSCSKWNQLLGFPFFSKLTFFVDACRVKMTATFLSSQWHLELFDEWWSHLQLSARQLSQDLTKSTKDELVELILIFGCKYWFNCVIIGVSVSLSEDSTFGCQWSRW